MYGFYLIEGINKISIYDKIYRSVLLGIYFFNRLIYGHQIMLNYENCNTINQKIVFLDFYTYKTESFMLKYKSSHIKKYIENNIFIINNKNIQQYKNFIKNKIIYCNKIFDNREFKLDKIKNDYELVRKIDLYHDYYKNVYCFHNILNYVDNINIENISCPICLEKISDNKLILTDCGHAFCIDCFFVSSKYLKKCLECRKNIDIQGLTHIINKKYQQNIFEYYKIDYLVKFLGSKLTFVIKYIYDNHINNQIIFLSNNNNILEIVSNILHKFNIDNTIYSGCEDSKNNIILFNYKIKNNNLSLLRNTVIIFHEPPQNSVQEKDLLKHIFNSNLNMIKSTIKFIIRGTEEDKV